MKFILDHNRSGSGHRAMSETPPGDSEPQYRDAERAGRYIGGISSKRIKAPWATDYSSLPGSDEQVAIEQKYLGDLIGFQKWEHPERR